MAAQLRTIKLMSDTRDRKAEVTIMFEGDVLNISPDDRDFLDDLLAVVEKYEDDTGRAPAPSGIVP